MLFVLGILSIFQITTLPGMVILKFIGLRGSIIQRMVYTVALSLVFNYCFAFLTAVLGIYNRWTLFLVFVLEICALLWLHRDTFSKPITSAMQDINDVIVNTIHSIFPHSEVMEAGKGKLNLLNTSFILVSLGMAISSILWVFKIFIYNLGTVFDAWDTIVSWNNWALTWATGSIPLNSRLYPQLIPANWSVTYLFMGETTVQFFAKGIMPLFAFLILLAIFDLGIKRNALGFFTAVTIVRLLMKKFLVDEITNGYVDLAVAFFAFLAVYALLAAREMKDNKDQFQLQLFLGALFAASAAVTKQAGVYMLSIYPVLAYVGVIRPYFPELERKEWKKYLLVYSLASLIPAIWYIMKGVVILSGRDFPEITELIQLSSATHGNVGIVHQTIASFARFEWYLFLFAVSVGGFFLLDPLYRALILLLIIPYPLIWSWLAGYDTRNLSIFIPILGITSGMALQEIYKVLIQRIERSPLVNVRVYILPILLMLFLAIGGYLIPTEKLRTTQLELQKQVFSPSKNQQIYDLVAREGKDTKILTNYPVAYLPGLDNNQIFFSFQDYEKFLSLETDPDVEFIFISSSANEEIKKHINREIEKGNFILLFVDKEWVTYRMVQIVKR